MYDGTAISRARKRTEQRVYGQFCLFCGLLVSSQRRQCRAQVQMCAARVTTSRPLVLTQLQLESLAQVLECGVVPTSMSTEASHVVQRHCAQPKGHIGR